MYHPYSSQSAEAPAPAPEPPPSHVIYPTPEHPIWERPHQGRAAVCICHFNPCGFQRPRWNLNAFLTDQLRHGSSVFAAELSFDGHFEMPGHPRVLRLRGELPRHLTFAKETLWNAVEKIVPESYDQLIFMDADLIMRRPDWLEATSAALASHRILQPYSHATWRDRYGKEAKGSTPGKIYAAKTLPRPRTLCCAASHPGFGVAFRRRTFRELGGFFPQSWVGNGDSFLMLSALGEWAASHERRHIPSPGQLAAMDAASARIQQVCNGQIGFVPGDALHLWHGTVSDRKYVERKDLLKHYTPGMLSVDPSGLAAWTDAAMENGELMSGLQQYFFGRREDG